MTASAPPVSLPSHSPTGHFSTDSLRSLWHYHELLWNLVIRNLKVRYKNSSLGFLWTLLNPLFSILIWFFFIKLARFQMDLAQLLSGLIVWHFLSMTLGDSIESISGNATLITKVRFPRIILPLSTLIANCINYFASLVVLLLFIPLLGHTLTWNVLWLPVLILGTAVFVFGLVLIVATANVFFKDTSHILTILLQAWFFMTPIIYPLDILPKDLPEKLIAAAPWLSWLNPQEFIFLNPMATLVSSYRTALLGQPLQWTSFHAMSCVIAVAMLIFGTLLFQRMEPTFADEL